MKSDQLKEAMAQGRYNRAQRRVESKRQPIAFFVEPSSYRDARPVARLPQGGDIPIEPLSNSSIPSDGFVAVRQGSRAIGLWMPKG